MAHFRNLTMTARAKLDFTGLSPLIPLDPCTDPLYHSPHGHFYNSRPDNSLLYLYLRAMTAVLPASTMSPYGFLLYVFAAHASWLVLELWKQRPLPSPTI